MSLLKKRYNDVIRKKLQERFSYLNIHQIPKLKKIVLNSGLGLLSQNKNYLEKAVEEYCSITGQYPLLTLAKKSIAGFKIRKKMPLGLTTTLRREKMYAFFEKLIKLAIPRIRDFQGLNIKNFDKFGNYNFGISDQFIFPEISFEKIDKPRGFNVTIVTTANNIEESYYLLEELGFPFKKDKFSKNIP